MRPSTAVELVGFALLSVAAWMLHPIAGVTAAGAACLLIGYATEDQAAVVAIGRFVNPVRVRRQKRKAARAQRREERRRKSAQS